MEVKKTYIVKHPQSHEDNEYAMLFELIEGTYMIKYPNEYGEESIRPFPNKSAIRLIRGK